MRAIWGAVGILGLACSSNPHGGEGKGGENSGSHAQGGMGNGGTSSGGFAGELAAGTGPRGGSAGLAGESSSGSAGSAAMAGEAGETNTAGSSEVGGAGVAGTAGQAGTPGTAEGGTPGTAEGGGGGTLGAPTGGTAGTAGTAGGRPIGDPPRILTTSLSLARVGSNVVQRLLAKGGSKPYAFMVSSGALPAGLSLTRRGTFDGQPLVEGTFAFTAKLTDAEGRDTEQALSLDVTRHRWFAVTLLDDHERPSAHSLELLSSGSTAAGARLSYPDVDRFAQYSPAGAFFLYRTGDQTGNFLMRSTAGTAVGAAVDVSSWQQFPTFSPDSKFLLGVVSGKLWLAPSAAPTSVSELNVACLPSWSSDAAKLALACPNGISIIDTDGPDLEPRAIGVGSDCSLVGWSPDSSKLAFACGGALSLVDVDTDDWPVTRLGAGQALGFVRSYAFAYRDGNGKLAFVKLSGGISEPNVASLALPAGSSLTRSVGARAVFAEASTGDYLWVDFSRAVSQRVHADFLGPQLGHYANWRGGVVASTLDFFAFDGATTPLISAPSSHAPTWLADERIVSTISGGQIAFTYLQAPLQTQTVALSNAFVEVQFDPTGTVAVASASEVRPEAIALDRTSVSHIGTSPPCDINQTGTFVAPRGDRVFYCGQVCTVTAAGIGDCHRIWTAYTTRNDGYWASDSLFRLESSVGVNYGSSPDPYNLQLFDAVAGTQYALFSGYGSATGWHTSYESSVPQP